MGKLKITQFSPIQTLPILSAFILLLFLRFTGGNYVEQYLDSVEVCAAGSGGVHRLGVIGDYIGDFTKKKVRLANFPNNTVVIKLSRWDEMWSAFYNFRCQFTVSAPKRQGVVMTVRSLHLRTKGGLTTKSCRDFLKFKQDNELWTNPVCGEVAKDDMNKSPETLLGPRSMSSSKGEIDVLFHSGGSEPFGDNEDNKAIGIELVFTAVSDCSSSSVKRDIADDKMRQCSPLRKMSCIPKNLYCDGTINCGFDEDFAADELECSSETVRSTDFKRSISLYVFAVSAVSTLAIVIMFVLLVCCCMRKFQKPPRPANESRRSPLDIEFHLNTSGPPSAPPLTLDRHMHTSDTTKSAEDLPPPYDALFPANEVSAPKPVQKKK